jgi:hypothetical protein
MPMLKVVPCNGTTDPKQQLRYDAASGHITLNNPNPKDPNSAPSCLTIEEEYGALTAGPLVNLGGCPPGTKFHNEFRFNISVR